MQTLPRWPLPSLPSTALEGDLGWRRAGELPTLFSDAVLDMQVDDVMGPIATGSTIHIIRLLDRRELRTDVLRKPTSAIF